MKSADTDTETGAAIDADQSAQMRAMFNSLMGGGATMDINALMQRILLERQEEEEEEEEEAAAEREGRDDVENTILQPLLARDA